MTRCRALLTVIPAALVACGGDNTAPNVDSRCARLGKDAGPGRWRALLQEMPPVGALNVYVNDFHLFNVSLLLGHPMLMMGFTADGQAEAPPDQRA
jgi:hypothetical protein